MSEETTTTGTASERAGFCQDCGKPLTRETARAVGHGVFCEPCLARRLGTPLPGYPGAPAQPAPGVPPAGSQSHGPAPWGSAWNPPSGSSVPPGHVPPGSVPPVGGYVPPPGVHLPNPTLAGVLGVIPGVGAMYNGQLVKGLLHLGIFAVLVTLDNNVSGVFGLFVAAWVIYQIFDAYQTALARRHGQPLPDALGLGDLANRIGLKPNFTPQATYQTGAPTPTQETPTASTTDPAAAANPTPDVPPPGYAPGSPAYAASYPAPPANWAGYVHPATFAAASPPMPPSYVPPSTVSSGTPAGEPVQAQTLPNAAAGATPYTGAYTGTGAAPILPPAPSHRFPIGAVWLIALGALLLAGTLSAEWRLSGLWVLAGLFAALAVWSLVRRLEWAGGYDAVTHGEWPRLASMLRAPILLLTLSVLFVLQAAHVATFGQTWPVLLVALGITVFLERTFAPQAAASLPPLPPMPPYPVPVGGAPAPATEAVETHAVDVRP